MTGDGSVRIGSGSALVDLAATEIQISLPEPVLVRLAEMVADILTARQCGKAVEPMSPYMTVPEAAEHLRCSRQRVDNLLSARRLTRIKDGRRTLVARSEVEQRLVREPRRGKG